MESRIRREVYVRFGGEFTRNLPWKHDKARGRLSHYDAAEGLLTATILLIAEFLPPTEVDGALIEKRHIVSVYKLVQDLLEPSPAKGKEKPPSQFQLLMKKLPSTRKAKWFAGAALNSADQAMASILSTVLSRLNAFLDSELEQILCFDTAIDAEKFCHEKSAIFLILPEEDSTKYFMVSLFLQQFYREMLSVADLNGGKLPRRVMIYADEIGTIPKIESFEMMLPAGRSRRISVVPIIQSFAQLDKNYGKEGSQIIVDNCQLTLFGGFAPNSESAQNQRNRGGTPSTASASCIRWARMRPKIRNKEGATRLRSLRSPTIILHPERNRTEQDTL